MSETIIVQGALQSEIDYLLKTFVPEKEVNVGDYFFYECNYKSIRVVLCKTKMGEISSAIATTLAVQRYTPVFILNQGTAGAFTESLNKGDIVVGKRVCYISQYSTESDKENNIINPWKANEYRTLDGEVISMKASEKILTLLRNLETLKKSNVYFGNIASGDVWTKDLSTIEKYNQKYGVICEAMECTGAYMAANSLGVPLISIRCISNNELKKQEYDEKCGEYVQHLVTEIIDELVEKSFLFF